MCVPLTSKVCSSEGVLVVFVESYSHHAESGRSHLCRKELHPPGPPSFLLPDPSSLVSTPAFAVLDTSCKWSRVNVTGNCM